MIITDEQIAAIFGDSPFVVRLTLDKRQYEIVQAMNHDWREVITNDKPKHYGYYKSHDEAEKVRRRLHTRWVLKGWEALMEWQPIETAPKDGTWVLVYGDGTDDEAEDRKVAVAQYVNYFDDFRWQFAWYDGGYYGRFKNPTHWAPLPEAPNG